MKLEQAKGTRDFHPEEKILRQEIVDILKKIFELYGYAPLETPIIERYEVLSAKFAAGEESDAMKETFTLTDQGGRKLGLRFDLTVPFARYISMNPNLKMPFKRYQIERVYRDGPIKLGRSREFWQCDVDIAGSSSILADAEMIDIAVKAFKELGLSVEIEYNSRKIIDGVLQSRGIQSRQAMIILDKIKKQPRAQLEKEWKQAGLENSKFNEILAVLESDSLLNSKSDHLSSGIQEINELKSYLKQMGISATFNPGLARGLGYYTGIVFEGFLKSITSSVCGGGRYDNMIANYSGRQVPATGISFGLEPITQAMKQKKALKSTPTSIYVVPIGKTSYAIELVKKLRDQGINTDMDLCNRGISKNMGYANAMKIPYVVIIGEDELKQGKIKLRDMKTGKEKLIEPQEISAHTAR